MTRGEKMIISLTGCSHALTHGYLLVFPAVLLLLKKDFDLGYLGLGVISNIMSFSYGLGALPGGMIFNRFGPKKLYLVCFLGSTLACLLIAASPNLLIFTIGLAILGALGSVYHPLANALISTKVKEFGRGLGIHGAAGNIGLATAPFLAGLIGSQWGWRFAYLVFMVPGIALSIWALFVDMTIEAAEAKPAGSGGFPIWPNGPRILGLFFRSPGAPLLGQHAPEFQLPRRGHLPADVHEPIHLLPNPFLGQRGHRRNAFRNRFVHGCFRTICGRRPVGEKKPEAKHCRDGGF
jgi:MFS family permease